MGFRGIGSSDKEMGAGGEHENQVGKENSLRYTRWGRITAESDVVDTAEDGTGLSLKEDSIQMGGLGDGSSLEDEFDNWAVFDEGSNDHIPQTRDEMVAELEMMLGLTTIARCGTIVCIRYLGLEIYLSIVPLGEHVLTEQDRDNIHACKL